MTDIVERLARWRDEDHSDKLILTRHEAITLHEEIKRLRAVRDDVHRDNERLVRELAEAANEIELLRKDNEWLRNELKYFGLPTDYKR